MKALQKVDYVENRLGITAARAYELCRLGVLPHVRIGRQLRFDPEQIEGWIAGGGQELEGGWKRDAA